MIRRSWVAVMIICSVALLPAVSDGQFNYPNTKRTDHVDVLHGVKVPDPYRWLEQDVRKSKEVAEWVAAENKVTSAYLKSIPERKSIQQRLTELWNYEKFSAPFKLGGRYFYTKNDGLQNQSVLYTMDSLNGEPRVLIDPNKWSKDGTVALAGIAVSDNGKYLAYGVADSGSDWRTWRVMNIDSGKLQSDELKWIKFSSVSWTADSKGFFYSRYDEPKEGAKFQSLNLNQKVFYHRIGTAQADDTLVYLRPDHPDWGFSAEVSEDGKYLIITTWKGTDDRYRITYKDLSKPYGLPTELIDDFKNEYSFVGNDGPILYFKTNLDAPLGRLISIDIRKPDPKNWKEVLPQAQENLRSVGLVGNMFVARYLKDARSQVKLHTLDGALVREVEFPTIGSAVGFGGRRTDTETFYSFSSFATPPSIYSYDLITGKSKLIRQAKVKFDPSEYQVKQIFYKSKDGTKVPMFITARKDVKLDGANPTLLYGYGGFNIPLTPRFSISRLAWMEMGGVYAVANLRGGGEYGEKWHKAGTKLQKQNVFDDFIAAAEWLISNKYTRTDKLAIQGGSNGGLLVGACLTQRPDLFGACLPAVGVMDMLRFHKFTAGRFWVDDYGSPDDPKEFKALHAYSPYHNMKKGTRYPATLVTTADTDDRVVPGHSFKFIAELQYCQSGPAPVLARIETKAGHGAGKPTAKIIEEVADQWAFLVRNLRMRIPERPIAGTKPDKISEEVKKSIAGLKADDPKARIRAALELARNGEDAKGAIPDLLVALKDEDEEVRGHVVYALGQIAAEAKSEAVVKPLVEALKDKQDKVRQLAIDALGLLGPTAKSAVPSLAAALKDDDLGPRAATALGRIGPAAKDAIPALATALRKEATRAYAAHALGRIGPDSIKALAEALKDKDDDVRIDAVVALGIIGPKAAESLATALEDKSVDVRLNAAGALVRLGKEAKVALKALIKAVKDPDEDVRFRVVTTLGLIGPDAKEAIPALDEAVKDKDENVREAAGEALERIRSKQE